MLSRDFWRGKTVFVTGHSGFKGGWLSLWLRRLGARVSGYALPPDTAPSFFELCDVGQAVPSTFADIRDPARLAKALQDCDPEVVFHLAAQPLVRPSYHTPLETFAVNIMGTAHLLEAVRSAPRVRAVVVITSDKCYQNRGWVWGYREDEAMGGRDPYSCSKGCAELVTAAYQQSFFRGSPATVASVRAGNVIGGGDWARDRIIPDAVRAFSRGESLGVRNPDAVRPWQHVLEPLSGYLMLAERLYCEQQRWEGGWNFGPGETDTVPVSTLAGWMAEQWGDGAAWHDARQPGAPHEEPYLTLDSSKARHRLNWRPRLGIAEAVAWTVAWYREALRRSAASMRDFTEHQIACYEEMWGRAMPCAGLSAPHVERK